MKNGVSSISRTAAQKTRICGEIGLYWLPHTADTLDCYRAEALLDFDLLQRSALDLMGNNPTVLDEIRRSYPWILVDEYQDTDAAQDRILRLLAGDGKRFTAVGDDDQSIYRFSGATVRNILAFKARVEGNQAGNATFVARNLLCRTLNK